MVRIILDACVPRVFGSELTGHQVTTAANLGLQHLDDGPLLEAISNRCDVFVTVDKSIRWQQTLDHRPFCVILLRSKSNRLEDLLPLVPALMIALQFARPGRFVELP